MRWVTIISTCLFLLASLQANAQLSPGELTRSHADLEGIRNCTKCHVLGDKVSNDKCLECHKDLRSRIQSRKGYHTSREVKGKECASCHSEHHGRQFEMIRFDQKTFDHKLTGYELTGSHKKIDCRECHKPDLINDREIRARKIPSLDFPRNVLCVMRIPISAPWVRIVPPVIPPMPLPRQPNSTTTSPTLP
ncbi:MAG: hypothetical protein IPJ06_15575 [Saprospiraceae bacterium]|nr:hypothetical protein [Saprospiraceae bacterium]